LAGTAVDLLFFPIDTIKTRLQSPQGFYRAGGFKGIYKGVGSVGVGSAPGGTLIFHLAVIVYVSNEKLAAVFFAAYDTLKHNSPHPAHPVTHMFAASVAEVVSQLVSRRDKRVRFPNLVLGSMSRPSSYRGDQNSSSDLDVWARAIVPLCCKIHTLQRWLGRLLSRVWIDYNARGQ
jgi:solute carrier family 25 S-adenosylmethionine transporter 26